MDYTALLAELNKASTFDLFRIYAAIDKELDQPARITAIKAALHIGIKLSYFHLADNRLIDATLLEMRRKTAVVLDHEQNKRFAIPYYTLNVGNVDIDIQQTSPSETLSANTLKVGETVGFHDRQGHPVAGVIQRLNQKTVTVKTITGHTWRVSYGLLHRVHDGMLSSEDYIETLK